MRQRSAFTLIELLVIIVVIVALLAILIPMLATSRKRNRLAVNANHLRAQHQGMVIFADTNAIRFPGLEHETGLMVPAGIATSGDPAADGSVAGVRYWILLGGSFISPQLIINPQEARNLWAGGPVTTRNHSYAMMRITTNSTDAGRQAEWLDNANGAAPMICDRNTGPDNTDRHVQSLWTSRPGDWSGHVAWGDDHVTLEPSHRLGTITIYNAVVTTGDNLFAATAAPGVTEPAGDAGANAMMTTTN